MPSKLAALLPEVQGVDCVKLRWSPPLDAATAVADLQILSYKILITWCLAFENYISYNNIYIYMYT